MLAPVGEAETLADVRGDYVPASTFPLEDTFGTGTWTYYRMLNDNFSSRTELIWIDPPEKGQSGPYYGVPTDGFGLPGVRDGQLYDDGAAPSADQIAWHPTLNDSVNIQWVAGVGESGPLLLSGSFSQVGEGNSSVVFSIFVNGLSVYSLTTPNPGSNNGVSTPFSIPFTSAEGTTVDFVLETNSPIGGQESLLSANIATVPEPSTWAMLFVAFGVAMVGLRRTKRVENS